MNSSPPPTDNPWLIGFFLLWAALAVASFLLFSRGNDVQFKRKWFPRFMIFCGLLMAVFVSLLMFMRTPPNGNDFLLAAFPVVLVMVLGVVYINIKLFKFCGACGKMIYPYGSLMPAKFCPKCGSAINNN